MSTQSNNIYQDDYIYPRTIDWPRILEDIKEHGINYSGVSRMLGKPWSTVTHWREGCEPRHSSGCGLLAIHAKYCGVDLTKQRVAEAEQ